MLMNVNSPARQSLRERYGSMLTMLLLVVLIAVFVLFTYTFLHEGGHALAGLLFGQTLTEFHINLFKWEAYVGMVGNLPPALEAIQSIAGAALPLLVWFIAIHYAPRRTTFTLETLKLLGSMVVLNTLLAWIVLPVLYFLGNAPPDDVTHFLHSSQMPPLLLSFTAAVLYARGWAVFLSKTEGLRNELLLFSSTDRTTLTAGTRKSLPILAGILALSLLLAFLLHNVVADPSQRLLSPPPDFEIVTEIDLSARGYSDEAVAEFTLQEATNVGIFVVIHNINTAYFDLSVTGPDGYSAVVLHGEGYRAERDGGLWEDQLTPGTYQVVLNSHQSPGAVAIFCEFPK